VEANEHTKFISLIIIYLPSLSRNRLRNLFGKIKSEAIEQMTEDEEIDSHVEVEKQVFFENDLTAPAFIQTILRREKQ
jgi:hypothetical protein